MATTLAEARTITAPPNEVERRDNLWLEAAIVLVAAAGAAIACTWPLVTKLGSVAHDAYDPIVQAWTIDWVQHAVGTPAHLFDANIFAPQPDTLAYSDSLLGIAIPLIPLRWIGLSPIAQLNMAVLVGSSMTAASAYLFGRVVTGSRAVGAVTGAAFAFGPLATTHIGHVQTVWRAGIPLSALAAWVLADRAERGVSTWPPAVALFVVLSWQASVSFHPAAYAFVATVIVLLVRWRSLGRSGAIAAGAALIGSIGVMFLLALPYLSNASRFDDFDFGLETLRNYSVDFTSTDPRLWLWGSSLGKGTGWPAYGGSSFPGAVLIVLTPFGIVAGWRDRRLRRCTVTGIVLIVTGAVLAIGASNQGWRRFTPYRALYEWVPGWRALRATDRAWFIGILGVALLAGIGARAVGRWLVARRNRVGVAIVSSLAVLGILIEGYAPWTDLPSVRVEPVDARLATLRTSGGVVYLPANATGSTTIDLSVWDQPLNMYGTTAHHRRTPNGFASYTPKSYATTFAQLMTLPDERALDTLRALRVRYVVVHPKVAGGPWARLLDPRQARPLHLIGRFADDLLYEITPAGGAARS
jgi:hypothetical protein